MDAPIITADDFSVEVEHGYDDAEPVAPAVVGLIVAFLIDGDDVLGSVRRLGELIERHQLRGLPVARANAEAVRTALLAAIRAASH